MSLDNLIEQLRTSSISDTGVYRGICSAAAQSKVVFDEFRRLPGYTRILEHVSQEQGQAYLDEIRRLAPHVLRDPTWFTANDEHGNPIQFDYKDIGLVSPTTLRYVKVAVELQSLFGVEVLNNARVIEIGGGYGGQARILKALFPATQYTTMQYTIIDLPEPLALADAYLKKYNMHVDLIDGLRYAQPNTSIGLPGDVFISNYALTECSPDVMAIYIKHVALNCSHGYITGNAQEKRLFELLPRARRLDETPLTGPGNFVCVWP